MPKRTAKSSTNVGPDRKKKKTNPTKESKAATSRSLTSESLSKMNAKNAITSEADFLREAEKVEFIHLVYVDIHGIPRIRVYPKHKAKSMTKEGVNSVCCILAFATDGVVSLVEEHTKINFGNITLRPVYETTRNWPWWNAACNSSAIQVFASPSWLDGKDIESDSRRIALKQLNRLHERGYDIFWGTECEFRLFQRENDSKGEPVPTSDTLNLFIQELVTKYEPIYTGIHRRVNDLGFSLDCFHTEYGHGQVEFPLSPEWGIKHADDLVRFKMVAKDVARENGLRASFMSKSYPSQTGNGFHLNHSIWKGKEENIMLDDSKPDKMSDFAKHWLAGLLHHSKALTAVTSPTVNCYRRLHNPWCPTYCDWGIENRFATFRFKNGGTPNSTYLENRSSSSAANPYLSLAATIAAGLDGVDKKLSLVDDGSKEKGLLPRNLQEALNELNKDEAMVNELGKSFVDCFTTVKNEELANLKDVDVTVENSEHFTKERKHYFQFV